MKVTLIELVTQLRDKRKELELLSDTFKVLEETFRTQHGDLLNEIDGLKYEINELDKSIREEAVFDYEINGNKAPCAGIGIRVTTQYDYEPTAAFDWAKQHGMALMLDNKAFKEICKSETNRPKFVEVSEVTTTTIATDLEKALNGAG